MRSIPHSKMALTMLDRRRLLLLQKKKLLLLLLLTTTLETSTKTQQTEPTNPTKSTVPTKTLAKTKQTKLTKSTKRILTNKPRRQYRKKRWWVRPCWRKRRQEGHFSTLLADMDKYDHTSFHRFMRMSPAIFNMLTELVRNAISKRNFIRESLSPAHRLAITLRFLATGDGYPSIAYAFRIGVSTAHIVILETCKALWEILQPIYMPTPSTDAWEKSANEFAKVWNFPGCCGTVDGRHMVIQQSSKASSKEPNSIALLAVVDARYNFLTVDVGSYGCQSDGGIFKSSAIGCALEDEKLGLPGAITLPNNTIHTNHVLIGGEAFQLRSDFTCPYSSECLDGKQQVFNNQLSQARRCSENAFGILAAKWRVFRRPLVMKPENVSKVVKATLVLHNFLLQEESKLSEDQRLYCPTGYAGSIDCFGNYVNGQWTQEFKDSALRPLAPTNSLTFTSQAADVRNAYADYFWSTEGEVQWQLNVAGVVQPH